MTGAMIMPVIPFTFYNADGQPFGNDQSNNEHSDTTHGASHLSDDANFNSSGYGFDTVTHHQDGFNHSSFTETAYQDHTAYSSTHENSWESNSFHTPETPVYNDSVQHDYFNTLNTDNFAYPSDDHNGSSVLCDSHHVYHHIVKNSYNDNQAYGDSMPDGADSHSCVDSDGDGVCDSCGDSD